MVRAFRLGSFRRYGLWFGTMQFFYSFKSVTLIWGYLVAGCSPNTLNFIVLCFCTRFPPGLSVLMASNLMTFGNLLLGNLSLSSGVKLLGETMVQTDATLLAKNSQHCWMLHVASVCTPCCMLLNVVGQSLKPVKLSAPGKRTQYCCVRLQVALKSTP